MKRIGILGGMGPEATILLQQRLIDGIAARGDEDHIPLLIDMNTQVPSRLTWLLEQKGQDPGPVLAAMARALETHGADALAMPCNTAHHFAKEITDALTVPFFNMPDLAAKQAAQLTGENGIVGVLASPATDITNLFSNALKPYKCKALYPADQTPMLSAIKSIKSQGITQSSIDTLQAQAEALTTAGAECVLIGCSEFSILSNKLKSTSKVLDTLDVLAHHIIEFSGATQRRT